MATPESGASKPSSTPPRESLLSGTELSPPSAPVAPEVYRGRRLALTTLLVLSFLTVAWIASPLWVGIAFGTVMGFTAQNAYRQLAMRIGDRRPLAAALTTIVSGLVCAALGFLVVWLLTRELVSVVAWLQPKIASGSAQDLFGARGSRLIDRLGLDQVAVIARVRGELERASHSAAQAAAVVLQTTTSAMLGLIIALLTMYYVLLDWNRIVLRLERVLPLDPKHTRLLILEFRNVGRSAFVGTVATAGVQGVLAGIGFWIVGVPQPVTWGTFTAVASFLPVVGTSLVWVPVGIYVLLKGKIAGGIFCLAWGLLMVMGVSDYVIRPRLVGREGSSSHPLLTLLALLGGIEVFGLAGLIVAPMLMSLFLAVLRIYEREAGNEPAPLPVTPPPLGPKREP